MKLAGDLKSCEVKKIANLALIFIFSPLDFVLKHDVGWRKIHHLFHHIERLVNGHILDGTFEIRYILF